MLLAKCFGVRHLFSYSPLKNNGLCLQYCQTASTKYLSKLSYVSNILERKKTAMKPMKTIVTVETTAAGLWCPHCAVRRRLHSSFRRPVRPPSAPELSLLLRFQSATACRKQLVLRDLWWRCSESHRRRKCSRDLILTKIENNSTNTWLTVRFPSVPRSRSFWTDDTIRHDTRCYFNVRSKADMSQLNLPHGTDN